MYYHVWPIFVPCFPKKITYQNAKRTRLVVDSWYLIVDSWWWSRKNRKNTLHVPRFFFFRCNSWSQNQALRAEMLARHVRENCSDSSIIGHCRILNWRYLPYRRPIVQAYVSGNLPRKYGQKYGTLAHFRTLKFPLILVKVFYNIVSPEFKWIGVKNWFREIVSPDCKFW